MTVKQRYLERFRERFVSEWAFDFKKPLWKGEAPDVNNVLVFLSEAMDAQLEETLKEVVNQWSLIGEKAKGDRDYFYDAMIPLFDKLCGQLKGKAQG